MSKIEEVARAMCDGDWNAKSFNETPNGEEPEDMRDYWRDKARTALLAIREPDEGMHDKLDELLDTFIGSDPDQRDVVGVFFVRAWRAAIDHALTQETSE